MKKMYESILQNIPEIYTDLDEFEVRFKALIQLMWNLAKHGRFMDGNSIGIPNLILVADRETAFNLKIPAPRKKEKELLRGGCFCIDTNSVKVMIKGAKLIYEKSTDLLSSIWSIIEKYPDLFYESVVKKGNSFEFINQKECKCPFVNDIRGSVPLDYCKCTEGKESRF